MAHHKLQMQKKAEIRNEFFASVFISDNNIMPLLPNYNVSTCIEQYLFTRKIIEKTLLALRPKTSIGPDKIPATFFKILAPELACPPRTNFQQILTKSRTTHPVENRNGHPNL